MCFLRARSEIFPFEVLWPGVVSEESCPLSNFRCGEYFLHSSLHIFLIFSYLCFPYSYDFFKFVFSFGVPFLLITPHAARKDGRLLEFPWLSRPATQRWTPSNKFSLANWATGFAEVLVAGMCREACSFSIFSATYIFFFFCGFLAIKAHCCW